MPEHVRINAIKDALNRAGVAVRTAFDIEVTAKPYEQLLTRMPRLDGGSRAEWRRSQGIADEPSKALPVNDPTQPMDSEVIDAEQDETACDPPVAPRYDDGRTITPDGDHTRRRRCAVSRAPTRIRSDGRHTERVRRDRPDT